MAAVLGLITVAAIMRGCGSSSEGGLPVPRTTEPASQLWEPRPGTTRTPPGTRYAGTLRTAGEWADQFDAAWDDERSTAEALSRSGDSWDHYTLSYDIDALTAAYLATGRSAYIDTGVGLLENVVATARPSADLTTSSYRDEYLGWTTQQNDIRGEEVPLYESYLWRYGVALLRVIRADPALWEDTQRQARFERLRTFVERNVFDKWRARGVDDTIYRSRAHMAAHWALIALGLAQITTDDSRRRAYLDVVNAIDNRLPNYPSSLRSQLRMNPRYPTAYEWSDTWGTAGGEQDVAHGNAVIAYVVAANAVGINWNDLDMRRFTDTFRLAVWPATARPGQPEGSEYVDGSGAGDGWFSDGFVKLGRFDPALQQRLERHDVGRSPQFMANGALNAAVLACRGIAPDAASQQVPACRLR